MSRVVVVNSLSLDGVMQAPGRADEDPRGGFSRGGWAQPCNDPVMGAAMGEGMGQTEALLLGRRTYQDFAGVWPGRKDNPFTEVLNNTQKYVAPRTLREPQPGRPAIRPPHRRPPGRQQGERSDEAVSAQRLPARWTRSPGRDAGPDLAAA